MAWVADVLKRIQTIKPGMTREALLKLFTTEGGLAFYTKQVERRTFVSRDCPYFKVDVELQAVDRSGHDRQRRVTFQEDPRDIIITISKPYLEFTIAD